jgi:type III secretory pathway lipoprotein EscJ
VDTVPFLFLIACAPIVDGPAESARAVDLADSDRLSAQLASLPGALSAHATLHHAFREPLTAASSPASAAVLVVIDGGADLATTRAAATALVRATAPDIVPDMAAANAAVVVEVGAPRPVLATVGPFTVEEHSRSRLIATLVAGLAIIAGLALVIARRARSALSAR